MKALTFLLAFVCLLNAFTSCKSNDEKLREKVTPIVKKAIFDEYKSLSTIDTIKIYRIDTLNDLRYFIIRGDNLLSKANDLIALVKEYNNEIASKQYDAKTSISNIRIANEYGSAILKEEASNSFDASVQTLGQLNSKAKKYNDTCQMLIQEYDKIALMVKQKKYNTKNIRGYIVAFKIIGADKHNTEIKKDSLSVVLSNSFRIIPYTQI